MSRSDRYSIGDAAAICHVSIQTLRHYDKIGLVQPAEKNTETGYRYYRKEQLLQIQMVRCLKNLEFSLDEIRSMLEAKSMEYVQERIREKLENLRREVERLQMVCDNSRLFLDRLRGGQSLLKNLAQNPDAETFCQDEMRLEEIPAQELIYVRRTLENYRNEEINIERWSELLSLIQREKVVNSGCICVIYHQKPLEHFYTKACDYEVCMPVQEVRTEHKNYYRHEDAFQAVTTYHVGSYSGLLQPYMMLMRWIEENHYRICGPMRDIFEVSPIDTSNPDEYVTKIVIPVCRQE